MSAAAGSQPLQWEHGVSTNPFSPFDSAPANGVVASTDAFGMAPWQENEAERRRTPSFSAAVGHGVQSSAGVLHPAPQRRETFHAGQRNPPSRQQAAVASVRPVSGHPVLAGSSVPDAFGHLPFDATDGPGIAYHQVGQTQSATTSPRHNPTSQQPVHFGAPQQQPSNPAALNQQREALLQREQELLDFKQEQIRKQEEQLQIHISTLKRKTQRLLQQQQEAQGQLQLQQQQQQQYTHSGQAHGQATSSSMSAPSSTDMFGMAEFQPADSSRPLSAAQGGAVMRDEFGMDQFAPPSSAVPDGAMAPAAVLSVDTLPANHMGTDSTQPINQRLANASSGLARIDTNSATVAGNASMTGTMTSSQRLPRSPENLFRKIPADGKTWHLMYKPVGDMMVQEGHSKSKAKWTPALVILQESNIFVHEHNPMNDNRTGGAQRQSFFETQSLAEVTLRHEMAFTPIERRRVDGESRVRLHTIKLQTHNHRERRTLKNLMAVTHEPIKQTVIKLGSYDLLLLESFSTDVMDAIRKLPLQLYQRTSFNRSEIFIDLVDRCIVQMDCYGVMKARTSTVHVMVQGFLTGMPECSLLINDAKMVDQRRRKARGCVTMPPHQATIRMSNVQLHPSVDQDAFAKESELRFHCMEAVRYEALRFMVGGSLPPPIRVTNLSVEVIADVVNTYVRLELQPHAGRVRHAIEKVEWHLPVPGSWHNILVRKTALGYRSVKSAERLIGTRTERSTAHASLEASTGVAKYEPENSAIVWRLDKFPPQAGTRVTLACHFQIQPGMTKTDFVNQSAMLRYNVTGSCVGGAQVWGLKITPQPKQPVKKWVRCETEFRYQVDLRPPQQTLATPDD